MHGTKRKQWSKEALNRKRLNDVKKIKDYRKLVDKVLTLKESQVYDLKSLKSTTELLEINPEFNTAWNFRRDIIDNIRNELDSEFWDNELKFTMKTLKRFPKVYWIWNHRVWVLSHHVDSSIKIWQKELFIVNQMLELDSRNYHGWHYRRIVIQNMERLGNKSLNHQEFQYTTEKINQNISNFSAWHQRVQLISMMFDHDEIANKLDLLKDELDYITNAMFTGADDQAVWDYICWFIEYDNVFKTLELKEYTKMLNDLQTNIVMINDDDKDFSGKENPWCLKVLILIENLQCKRGIKKSDDVLKSKEWLAKLIEVDPLRANRYRYLLDSQYHE
ncbi:Rab geranylgeranyltransferase BET4 NDAI_0C03710 [Naumovozyma dairenensis CBS 421]|uniref:Geranylgeranyl transferase type-2 subunit alpha n=1 Tax=Naumovozyma dairenensis (strain ATCC 10597 / BCRC 20456 / CBS 421 / NBRC 0211 / NRRL Y-12639) TaxID=1071378 RepID=G0W8C0_NAUDC|nr:hypothetical protein NDAI_0C03710 [Naumovozyma dairenensis CBS 421]CCD24031.1 hypothetical protein NDAI_0C03710 [Naumovozyma dairenensis CBS 421]